MSVRKRIIIIKKKTQSGTQPATIFTRVTSRDELALVCSSHDVHHGVEPTLLSNLRVLVAHLDAGIFFPPTFPTVTRRRVAFTRPLFQRLRASHDRIHIVYWYTTFNSRPLFQRRLSRPMSDRIDHVYTISRAALNRANVIGRLSE